MAFRLGGDIAPASEDEITADAVRAAVEVALPALEIVDSRIDQWAITFTDTVADNASSGLSSSARGAAAGPGRSRDRAGGRRMSLTVNGEVRSSGSGAACLGDPLEALRWLAVQCHLSATRCGPARSSSQSGALGPFVPFAPGDRVVASISGFEPLSVEFEVSTVGRGGPPPSSARATSAPT